VSRLSLSKSLGCVAAMKDKMTQFGLNSIRRILAVLPESNTPADWTAQIGVETHVCRNATDAISLAAAGHYDLIFLHLRQIQGHIEHALGSLRRADAASRIILLCSMVEEPLAIRLIGADPADGKSADDYLIYPQGFAQWTRDFVGHQKNTLSPINVETAQTLQRLEILATEDDLTGLKNRRYVRQFLRQILDYARRDRFHVTILLFDIDNFKPYNDHYGHPVGDEVLRQAGQIMKQCCRAHDVVARVGGDEFAVVFWDLPKANPDNSLTAERRKVFSEHPKEPFFMAQRFCRQLNANKPPCLGISGKGNLTISGGLASFPDDADNENQLWEQADQAMLQAKRSGKNKILIVGKPTPSQNTVLPS
jgi:diguanylate cyclase (GGDEF)-like protein